MLPINLKGSTGWLRLRLVGSAWASSAAKMGRKQCIPPVLSTMSPVPQLLREAGRLFEKREVGGLLEPDPAFSRRLQLAKILLGQLPRAHHVEAPDEEVRGQVECTHCVHQVGRGAIVDELLLVRAKASHEPDRVAERVLGRTQAIAEHRQPRRL